MLFILRMNVIFDNNLSFGQRVSTPLLLKAGSKVIKFEEAKLLNNQLGVTYSGYIGFHKRALDVAKKAASQDEELAKIFEELKAAPKEELDSLIVEYTKRLGENLDINV